MQFIIIRKQTRKLSIHQIDKRVFREDMLKPDHTCYCKIVLSEGLEIAMYAYLITFSEIYCFHCYYRHETYQRPQQLNVLPVLHSSHSL